MRNPFRRSVEATPSLHERASGLREGLNRRSAVLATAAAVAAPLPAMAAPQPVERANLYDKLLTLYAEDHNARPARDRHPAPARLRRLRGRA